MGQNTFAIISLALLGIGWLTFVTYAFMLFRRREKAEQEAECDHQYSKEIVDMVVLQDGTKHSEVCDDVTKPK